MRTFMKRFFLIGITVITVSACNNPFLNQRDAESYGNVNNTPSQNHYYIVSFEANGGTPVPGSQRIAHNGKVAKVHPVSKENYGFGGWFKDPDCTNEWNFARHTVTYNLTLYAKWGNPYYKVTFNANGGNPVPDSMNIMEGAKIPEPPALRKAISPGSDIWLGFGGWYKEPLLLNQWNFNTDTMGNYDIDLYAMWDIVPAGCQVIFEANGGDPAPRTQDLMPGAKVIEPYVMNKTGYGFGGWYKDIDFNTLWDFANDTVSLQTPVTTLYAKWVTEYYSVTFLANGGTPPPDNQIVAYGNKAARPPAMKNPGLGFGGWYTDSGFNSEWDFDTNTVKTNTTLYARWETAHYTVDFDLNYTYSEYPGGHGISAPQSQDVIHLGKAAEPPPITRAGYCFDGWYENAGCTVDWDFNTPVTNNMTLYARWVDFIPDMVWAAKGSYTMGDDYLSGASPGHKVKLSGYYIGKYQVTQIEYTRVMVGGRIPTETELNNAAYNPSSFKAGQFTRPVEKVSWYDAIAYCNKRTLQEIQEGISLTPVYSLNGSGDPNPDNWGAKPWDIVINPGANGYRLPTEAEWEYAARGGNNPLGNYIYSGSDNPDSVAWYNLNSGSQTHPVGTLASNQLGIYDMSGNVCEWCWDWYSPEYYKTSPEFNPMGPASGTERVRRGGCWSNAYGNVRTLVRGSISPSNATYVMGFRVVRLPSS